MFNITRTSNSNLNSATKTQEQSHRTESEEEAADVFSKRTQVPQSKSPTRITQHPALKDPKKKAIKKAHDALDGTTDMLNKNSIRSAANAAERNGLPFFFIELQGTTTNTTKTSRHTSAANYYNRHDEIYQILKEENFLTHSALLYMSFGTQLPAAKACAVSDVFAEDHYMTDAHRSIFYLNTDEEHETDPYYAKSALGFVAAMLLDGRIIPKNAIAAHRIISHIERSRRSEVLSPALSYYAENGDIPGFNRWIALGADIPTALTQGFNPLKDAVLNRRWDLARVILTHDLGYIPTDVLERHTKSAAADNQDDIATSIQSIITKRGQSADMKPA
jgi:hypothetical protein